jgi:hypothetical protein
MPDFFRIPNLIPLHAWLIEAGTNDVATETLFDGSARFAILILGCRHDADRCLSLDSFTLPLNGRAFLEGALLRERLGRRPRC